MATIETITSPASRVPINNNFNAINTQLINHVAGTADNHNASKVNNDSNVIGTKVSDALNTLSSVVESIEAADSNAQIGVYSLNAAGTANVITATYTGLTYYGGLKINMKVLATNTSSTTINLNSLGAKTVKIINSVGTKVDLAGGELTIGSIVNLEYDGTDFILLNKEVSDFSTPTTTTASVISLPNVGVVKSTFNELTLKGNTETNEITNGNLAVGTTGWDGVNATISASNNILSVIGNGGSDSPYVAQYSSIPCYSLLNHIIYVRAKSKVTNTACTVLQIHAGGTTGGGGAFKEQFTPTQNQIYNLSGVFTVSPSFTGNLLFLFVHRYADAATANGKVMEVQEVMAIDLTARFGAGNEPSLADCDKRYANWFDGTQHTGPVKVTATGKNMFDKSKAQIGMVNSGTGVVNTGVTTMYYSDYIPIKPSAAYYISNFGTILNITSVAGVSFYDFNKLYISGEDSTNNNKAFTAPSNAFYVRFNMLTDNLDTAQLELGSTATPYEPYTATESFVSWPQGTGKSLPNGVCDEIDLVKGVSRQRVSDEVVFDGSKALMINTSGANVDLVQSDLISAVYPNMKIGQETVVSGQIGFINKSIPEIAANNGAWDNASYAGCYFLDAYRINFIVAKGTFVDLAAAQTYYNNNPVSLNYCLAQEIVTKISPSVLLSHPNGSIIIENIIKDESVYASGITNSSGYAIKSLQKVQKVVILADNSIEYSNIDISTCTIASGGGSFTSTALADGDIVYWEANYDSSLSTLPSIVESHAINLIAGQESNSKAIGELGNSLSELWMFVIGGI